MSEHPRSSNTSIRAYRMTNRAAQVGQTRHRIVEAAVHLHETVGPAHTTVAAIAETAGVTRLTVYRHFPDTNSLYDACTAHWAAQQQLPDPDAWLLVHEPRDRLHTGLSDLYRFFADAASMLTRTTRDWDEIPDFVRERTAQRDRLSAETLLSALAQAPTDRDPRASDQACCHHQHLALPVPGPGHVQPGRRRRHMVKLIY